MVEFRATDQVFYRGPDGTVIDAGRLQAVLEDQGKVLRVERDSSSYEEVRSEVSGSLSRKLIDPSDDPCRAGIYRQFGSQLIGPLDYETFPARERVEGTARLLRRVFPEVVSHMTDQQWRDFQGAKA